MNLFGNYTGTRNSQSTRFQPEVEALDQRLVPATVNFVSGPGSGIFYIQGTDAADRVSVSQVNVFGSDFVVVKDMATDSVLNFALRSRVTGIIFAGNGGNDYYVNTTNVNSFAGGGAGNDTLIGGFGIDYLWGGDNNDVLYGGGGSDYLYGEAGNDYLNGGYYTAPEIYNPYDGAVDYLDGGSGYDTFRIEWYFGGNRDTEVGSFGESRW